jgi:hypothetical protein
LANLLVPAELVASLRIPDLTVSTGEPGGVWCPRPWGRLRWSRRYVIPLPYDPASAAKLRKQAVLDRVQQVFSPVYLAIMLWFSFRPTNRASLPLFAAGALIVFALLESRWKVGPRIARTGRGDLYVPDLPPAVARRWLDDNPGVRRVKRKPTYRRWPSWAYVTAALVCVAGAAEANRYTSTGASLLMVLALAGIVTFAYLALPTGHTRLDRSN